ncbi:MAG: hypothetical protein AAEJ59_04580 [Arenicellales bacterium]
MKILPEGAHKWTPVINPGGFEESYQFYPVLLPHKMTGLASLILFLHNNDYTGINQHAALCIEALCALRISI